ncbi:putative adenosine transporter [Neospora caninum Liverpool]|uniref:Adenosine transporter, putative n=1 Tax=Neospora caninum (strain Liverpool) TaxID=572307 RepID=F0VEG7_NEOCL|nr:putative adenosine transporter [Neospora caninum Liverpool]CBZ52111.1 putative adenosine transporter [Neospora caninum Liverpool]CEL66073.1 TPA: adenosine transporter, putative [Neospora caninum Liverpool]|eukprot:XP_003882143.1 putative adenosine transporter [Neospora caninum Liverpool]
MSTTEDRVAAASQQVSNAGSVAAKGPQALSRGDFLLASSFFLLVGVNSLIAWNITLNLNPYFSTHYFSGEEWGNTLLAMFQLACVFCQLYLLKFGTGGPNKLYFYYAAAVNVVTFVVFTPLVVYLPQTAAIACMHICCFFLGIGCGVLQGGGFPYAASLPYNFCGFISTGQGLAAILSFVWNTFFAFVCFDLDTPEGVEKMAWASYCFAACLSVLYFAMFLVILKKPWAQSPFERQVLEDVGAKGDKAMQAVDGKKGDREAQYEHQDDGTFAGTAHTSTVDVESGERVDGTEKRPARVFLLCAAPHFLNIGVTFFITLNNFPRIGPVGWNYNQQIANHFIILFGAYALGEFVGRFFPDLSQLCPKYFSWTMIPPKLVVPLALLRAVFYVPFFLGYKLHDTQVVNDFWFYFIIMLLFAFTHGWFCTLGFVYSMTSVRESERGVTAPLSVLSLSAGILAGLYLALAY